MFSLLPTFSIASALALGLTALLAGCGGQGYGPTNSYGARYSGGSGTAADAAPNNGSVSSSVLAQEHKEANYYGY